MKEVIFLKIYGKRKILSLLSQNNLIFNIK